MLPKKDQINISDHSKEKNTVIPQIIYDPVKDGTSGRGNVSPETFPPGSPLNTLTRVGQSPEIWQDYVPESTTPSWGPDSPDTGTPYKPSFDPFVVDSFNIAVGANNSTENANIHLATLSPELLELLEQDKNMQEVINKVGEEKAKKYAIKRGDRTNNQDISPYTPNDADLTHYHVESSKGRGKEIKVQAGFKMGQKLEAYYDIIFDYQKREVTISRLFIAKDSEKAADDGKTALLPDEMLDNLLSIAKKEAKKQDPSIDIENFRLESVKVDPIPNAAQKDYDTQATINLFMSKGKSKAFSSKGDNTYYGLLGSQVSREIYPFLRRNLEDKTVQRIKATPGFRGYALTFSSR